MTIKIYTADWVLPVSEPPIKRGAVAVEGARILAVAERDELIKRLTNEGRDYTLDDLGASAILPGLVNVHSHLELTVMRGYLEGLSFFDWISKLTSSRRMLLEEHLHASAVWGACEAARAGVTTLADTGDSGAAMDALIETGLRGVVFQEVFGPDPAQAEESLDGLKRKIERLSAKANSLVRVGVSPHAPYTVSAELFRKVARYAVAERLPAAVHAAESEAEEEFMRFGRGQFAEKLRSRNIRWDPPGCSVIEYLNRCDLLSASPLLIHCIRAADDDLSLISESGSGVAHCPKSNGKFGHGRAQLGAMLKAGVKAGLGTDSMASNNVCDLFEEARFCAFLHGSAEGPSVLWEARTMIEMMTLGGARALGLEVEIGTLEAGKQADLAAIDLSGASQTPLHDVEAAIVFCASAKDVRLTVAAGREIFTDGAITSVDEKAVEAALERAAAAIR